MRPMTRGRSLLLAVVLASAATAAAAEPMTLAINAGAIGISRHATQLSIGPELQIAPGYWGLQGVVGLAFDGGAQYGYVAIRREFWLGASRCGLVPFVGIGYYRQGTGFDLGSELEFISGLELALRLNERSALGLRFFHLSNGSVSDRNPGTEALVLSYSRRFGDGGR